MDGGDRLRSGKERVASGILRSVQQSAFSQTKGWLPILNADGISSDTPSVFRAEDRGRFRF
jgi:hypothetical protein